MTPTRPGQRFDNPWLRGVIMAPSVHYSMSVAAIGHQDYRTLAPFMHKPRTVLAMVFTADPHFGLTSVAFDGPAVAFMPTVTFVTRTAGLR